MSRPLRFAAAALFAVTVSAASAPSAPVAPATSTLAAWSSAATLDGTPSAALARRPSLRGPCVRWWTCGPFKREKPRLA